MVTLPIHCLLRLDWHLRLFLLRLTHERVESCLHIGELVAAVIHEDLRRKHRQYRSSRGREEDGLD